MNIFKYISKKENKDNILNKTLNNAKKVADDYFEKLKNKHTIKINNTNTLKTIELKENNNNNNNISTKENIKSIKDLNDKELDLEVKKTIELLKQKQSEKEKENLLKKQTIFAGEKFEYEKEATEKDIKKLQNQEKTKTNKELDSLIDNLTKKKDINIFDKTKVDWKNYVDKNNLTKELDYGRKDGYLSKKRFIEETNYKLSVDKKEKERKAKYLESLKYKK